MYSSGEIKNKDNSVFKKIYCLSCCVVIPQLTGKIVIGQLDIFLQVIREIANEGGADILSYRTPQSTSQTLVLLKIPYDDLSPRYKDAINRYEYTVLREADLPSSISATQRARITELLNSQRSATQQSSASASTENNTQSSQNTQVVPETPLMQVVSDSQLDQQSQNSDPSQEIL